MKKLMYNESVHLTWFELLSGSITGVLREVESLRNEVNWGHKANFNRYEKWGRSVSGTLSEMATSKKMQCYFSHSVNNFSGKDLIINEKPVQVRSQLITKPDQYKSLIIRKNYNPEDYYFYVIDDTPKFYLCGYIKAKDCQKYGNWTNFGINSRPYVWSIKPDQLKPIKDFKNE